MARLLARCLLLLLLVGSLIEGAGAFPGAASCSAGGTIITPFRRKASVGESGSSFIADVFVKPSCYQQQARTCTSPSCQSVPVKCLVPQQTEFSCSYQCELDSTGEVVPCPAVSVDLPLGPLQSDTSGAQNGDTRWYYSDDVHLKDGSMKNLHTTLEFQHETPCRPMKVTVLCSVSHIKIVDPICKGNIFGAGQGSSVHHIRCMPTTTTMTTTSFTTTSLTSTTTTTCIWALKPCGTCVSAGVTRCPNPMSRKLQENKACASAMSVNVYACDADDADNCLDHDVRYGHMVDLAVTVRNDGLGPLGASVNAVIRKGTKLGLYFADCGAGTASELPGSEALAPVADSWVLSTTARAMGTASQPSVEPEEDFGSAKIHFPADFSIGQSGSNAKHIEIGRLKRMVAESNRCVKVTAQFEHDSVLIKDPACAEGLSGGGSGETILRVLSTTTVTTTPCPTTTTTLFVTTTVTTTATRTITSTLTTTTEKPCACVELCCELPADIVGVDASRLFHNECPAWWDPLDGDDGTGTGHVDFGSTGTGHVDDGVRVPELAAPPQPLPPRQPQPQPPSPPPPYPPIAEERTLASPIVDADASHISGGGSDQQMFLLLGLVPAVLVLGGLTACWLPRMLRQPQPYSALPVHDDEEEARHPRTPVYKPKKSERSSSPKIKKTSTNDGGARAK